MARRGTSKRLSVDHEEFIAREYDGVRSASSGGAAHDQGDVRCPASLIECKATMAQGKPKILKEFEKIAAEAYSEGKSPLMALRYYAPDSPIADIDGWVDLSVRLVGDDRERELAYVNEARRNGEIEQRGSAIYVKGKHYHDPLS